MQRPRDAFERHNNRLQAHTILWARPPVVLRIKELQHAAEPVDARRNLLVGPAGHRLPCDPPTDELRDRHSVPGGLGAEHLQLDRRHPYTDKLCLLGIVPANGLNPR